MSVLFAVLLLTNPGTESAESIAPARREIVVELKNGYRIAGRLIEETERTVVIAVTGGEMRFSKRRIARLHDAKRAETSAEPPSATAPDGESSAEDAEASESKSSGAPETRPLVVPLQGDAERRGVLRLEIPRSWTAEKPTAAGELRFAVDGDAAEFAVRPLETASAFWGLPSRLRREYADERENFGVDRERFGNLWGAVKTWEIDFRFDANGTRFRERRLFLDFGFARPMFSFRSSASRFAAAVPRFESILGGMRYARPEADAPREAPTPAAGTDEAAAEGAAAVGAEAESTETPGLTREKRRRFPPREEETTPPVGVRTPQPEREDPASAPEASP